MKCLPGISSAILNAALWSTKITARNTPCTHTGYANITWVIRIYIQWKKTDCRGKIHNPELSEEVKESSSRNTLTQADSLIHSPLLNILVSKVSVRTVFFSIERKNKH